jgi:hypothetical protein
MFIGISGGSSIFLFPVLADFTGKYQTSNLGVGGSNPSERATSKPAVLALEAATSVRSSTPTELAAGCQKNRQQAGGNEEIQRSFLCERLSLCKQKYENKRSRHRCDGRPHIQAPIPAPHALTGQLLGLQ